MTRTEFILWTFAFFLLLVLKGPARGTNRNGEAPTGKPPGSSPAAPPNGEGK